MQRTHQAIKYEWINWQHYRAYRKKHNIFRVYTICHFEYPLAGWNTYLQYWHPVCELVSSYDFDLHFLDGWWYWASFHVLISYLCISFGLAFPLSCKHHHVGTLPEFKCYLLTELSWASHLTFISFRILAFNVQIIILTSRRCENWN